MRLRDKKLKLIYNDIEKYTKSINALIEITGDSLENQKFKYLLLVHMAREIEENIRRIHNNEMVDEVLKLYKESFPMKTRLTEIKEGELGE